MVLDCGRQIMRAVRRLISPQEQVSGSTCVAHHEVWIKRTGRAQSADSCIPVPALLGQLADASHVRRHGAGLIVLGIKLLVAILDLGRQILGQLVPENGDDLMVPADRLG